MCPRVIASTPKFLMFDLQKVNETEHMIFGADYIVVAPRTAEGRPIGFVGTIQPFPTLIVITGQAGQG
ncbi:hypothetical protein [Photobacterium gaetbulicola]|uniref:hypothetical protein n=1 Tax=Photobacterium gaetbulicola TaxID=1295392 RepID=UPI000AD0D078|nr:hypothetical protein [Photobacterium gaetbulicola]